MTLKEVAAHAERLGSVAADQPNTTMVAGAAVISPVWLPELSEISTYAASILPILGVVWLVVQIARAVWFWGMKR